MTETTSRPIQPLSKVKAAAETAKPAPHYYSEIRAPRQQAGVVVTEQTALTFGAVFAAMRCISEDIAGLGVRTRRKSASGKREELIDHPATRMLTRPNMEMSGFTLRETLQSHALSWGNGYAEIERNARGRPVALHLLTPDRVTPRRIDGRVVYQVSNFGMGPDTFLEAADMYHVHGLGYDGLVGYSVISMAARTIGVGIAGDEYGASTYQNRSVPSGVLKYPKTLDDDGKENIRKSWEHLFKGPRNASRVAILEEGMEYETLGLPPGDVQFIQNRNFQIEEIARWFRVPPHKLGHIMKATFNNIEEQNINYVQDALLPWTNRHEAEAERKLLAPAERGRVQVKLNLNSLLRGAIEKRTESYVKGRQWGWLSANDVRAWEDLDPLAPAVGDVYLTPMNMIPTELLAENARAKSAPPPSGSPGEPPAAPEPDPETQPGAHVRPVVRDAIRRCLQREYSHANRAPASLDNVQAYEQWGQKFYDKHPAYCADALQPACESALLANLDSVPGALSAIIRGFVEEFLADTRELFQYAWASNGLAALEDSLPAHVDNHTDRLMDGLAGLITLNAGA